MFYWFFILCLQYASNVNTRVVKEGWFIFSSNTTMLFDIEQKADLWSTNTSLHYKYTPVSVWYILSFTLLYIIHSTILLLHSVSIECMYTKFPDHISVLFEINVLWLRSCCVHVLRFNYIRKWFWFFYITLILLFDQSMKAGWLPFRSTIALTKGFVQL